MNEEERRAFLWLLIRALGETGKTKLQKVVYFLQEKYGVPLGYRFRLHHYGPYSLDLEGDTSHLRWKGYAQVVPDSAGYGYHITAEEEAPPGRQAVEEGYQGALQAALDALGADDVDTLELRATVHFVSSIMGTDDIDSVVKEVAVLKPRFHRQLIRSVAQETLGSTGQD